MRKITVAIFCLLSTTVFAQKAKNVVVFGATPAGLAAAIQSAHSGVKTTLIEHSALEQITLTVADKQYKLGVYKDFLKRVDTLLKGKNLNSENLLPAFTATVFKGWMDTIPNLTVIKKASAVKKIQRDGKVWEIEFADNSEIKAGAVVDASKNSEFAKLAGATQQALAFKSGIYPDKVYRTSIAFFDTPDLYPSGLPVTKLFADNAVNFVIIGENFKPNMLLGQAAGTAAAFCGFFEVENKDLDIRKTQGELITYGAQFLKFDDVSVYDSLAVPIMKVAITGIVKGKVKNGKFLFLQDSTVSTEEIRMPIREYYSRSQIWFLDHKSEKLTLEETLSLIKFCASRGNELDKEVDRGWKNVLKFEGKFDLKKPVTRRQFAHLVDLYMKPFERKIDLKGNLQS
jgi:hypothetical protein